MSTSRIVLLIIVVGTTDPASARRRHRPRLSTNPTWSATRGCCSLSYVDHAPLHVWITWAMERIFASEAPIVVRLPFVLLFAGSTWLMYRLTARLFGETRRLLGGNRLQPRAGLFASPRKLGAARRAGASSSCSPRRTWSRGILFDEPPSARRPLWWLAAGVLAGLALLSKYNAVFFFVAVFVYLLTVPSARRHLATAGPWLGAVAALIVTSPVIVWNPEHGLIGLFFQTRRVGAPSVLRLSWLEDIGGQALYLTPWLFVPFAISLVSAPRDAAIRAAGSGACSRSGRSACSRSSPSGPTACRIGRCPAGCSPSRCSVATPRNSPPVVRSLRAATWRLPLRSSSRSSSAASRFRRRAADSSRTRSSPQNPALDPTIDLIDWTRA